MKERLVSLFFPKTCISCHREGTHFCEDCLSLLSPNQWTFPLPTNSPLSALFSAVSYEEPLARLLIRQFKYPPFLRDLSNQCAYLIGAHIALARPDQDFSEFLVVPVPLHKRRLRWRGFNQAEEIARQLAWLVRAELIADALVRTRPTKSQVELSEQARKINIKKAFATEKPSVLRNKNVLLVDDVFTSGGTLEACAFALKKAGTKQVFGAVVARG